MKKGQNDEFYAQEFNNHIAMAPGFPVVAPGFPVVAPGFPVVACRNLEEIFPLKVGK